MLPMSMIYSTRNHFTASAILHTPFNPLSRGDLFPLLPYLRFVERLEEEGLRVGSRDHAGINGCECIPSVSNSLN